MAVIRALVFGVLIAGLLPPGTEMLDDLVRDLLSPGQQGVLATGQQERIGGARALCALPHILQSACALR